jgi:hypothetical protein
VALPGEMGPAADDLAARFASATAAEFVADCREFIREFGTLPQPLPRLRRQALRKIRDEHADKGVMAKWVAEHLGFNPNRFSKLTASKTTEEAAA